MNRRDFIKTTLGAAACSALLPYAAPLRAQDRPNIIFILTDDHRWDAFGFLKPWLPTPNMDRLAAEGVHFANSFVTTSLCSPSRASFLTGQYASRHGVQNNNTPWRDSNVTFLELLHAAGYHTGFIGKWHMPGKGIPDMVAQGKLDRMVSFSAGGGQGHYFDCPLVVDGKEREQPGYITDVLTDYSMDFLDAAKNKPFCLYLSHKAVHHEFLPPSKYENTLADAPLPKLVGPPIHPVGDIHIPQVNNFDRNQQGYYESLRAVDDSVGRILDWLDQTGQADNTLIVYAGDNGYYWGEHGLIDKRYAYEEGIRIPHLMRWPRRFPRGGVAVDSMVLNIDLMPTLLQAAGLTIPKQVQGMSYLDLPYAIDQIWRGSFLYEYFEDFAFPHPAMRAVRTDDWKLITYKKGLMQPEKFPDEMFHLATDPGETTNLAQNPEYAAKKKELKAELKRLIKLSS